MEFEWYSKKERLNIEKHGIDLETVKRVFDDPFRIIKYNVNKLSPHSGQEYSSIKRGGQFPSRGGHIVTAVWPPLRCSRAKARLSLTPQVNTSLNLLTGGNSQRSFQWTSPPLCLYHKPMNPYQVVIIDNHVLMRRGFIEIGVVSAFPRRLFLPKFWSILQGGGPV